MKKSLDKLLSIGSEALGVYSSAPVGVFSNAGKERGAELEAMLGKKNGFYAFSSALHVFPFGQRDTETGATIERWNSFEMWRSQYGLAGDNVLFFAEDLFGIQFCLHGDEVLNFDPETARFSYFASSLDEWGEKILVDYDYLTGYSLAHAWQEKNGVLIQGCRLLPKVPFVLGGNYEIDNLYLCDAVEGMRVRSELAQRIKDLPDGTELRFEVGE